MGSGSSTLDDIFNADYDGEKFFVGPTDDMDKAGDYELKLRFFYAENPTNFVESEVFTVHVIDACRPPAGYEFVPPQLIIPEMEDQVYTVTDEPIFYTIPKFTVEPAYCQPLIEYVADITVEGAAGAAVSF
jgi:hypothetical protein